MSNLSKIIELVEAGFGSGKAQLVSDLLTGADCELVVGREDICQAFQDIANLTASRDSIIDELPDMWKDTAESLAGGFISLGDAIAQLEVNKCQEDAHLAIEDDVAAKIFNMD